MYNIDSEQDPRKYCFGHSLYRRIVSMASAHKLRLCEKEKMDEVDETMEKINETMFDARGGRVEVFEFAMDEKVIVDDKEIPPYECKIIAQVMYREEDDDPITEAYIVSVGDDNLVAPEYITRIPKDETETKEV